MVSVQILAQYHSNHSQYVVVDGRRSKQVNVVSGVPSVQRFLSAFVPFVHRGAFLHNGEQDLRSC